MKAQLHSSLGRSSKAILDRKHIETIVEVAEVGKLLLFVDGAGTYALRAYPARAEAPRGTLLAYGVMTSDGILAIRPEEAAGGDEHDSG